MKKSQRSTILIIAPSTRTVGGQATQAQILVGAWQKDPDVCVNFLPNDPPINGKLDRLKYVRTLVRFVRYLISLRALRHFSLVHTFSASYWSFWLGTAPAVLLARTSGRPVIVHYHSAEAFDHLANWPISRFILRRADAIVVPSNYLQEVFDSFGFRVKAIPNVVDVERFRFRDRTPLRPMLLCTRALEPYYGIEVVLRAMAAIQAEYPNASLTLVGDGSLREEMEELSKTLGLTNTTFMGGVDPLRMQDMYERADILINASRLDNMPMSILEAFAAGTPVVSTAPDGIARLAEDGKTALLVECDDWNGLKSAVLRLLREPLQAVEMARRARKVAEQYSWIAVRTQWLSLYDELTSS